MSQMSGNDSPKAFTSPSKSQPMSAEDIADFINRKAEKADAYYSEVHPIPLENTMRGYRRLMGDSSDR